MNLSIRTGIFLILCMSGFSVLAQQTVMPIVPQGGIDDQKESAGGEHSFLLSTPKRIDNALSIDRQQRVKGDRHDVLIRINDGFSSEKAFRFYQRFISEHGKILYLCEQYDCGSSNYWANTIFSERKLYGRDNNQYYVAGKVNVDNQNYWLSVYSVMNGKRQDYVYLSYVLVDEATPAINTITQWRTGYALKVSKLSKQEISFVSEQLVSDPALVIWVTAFANSTSKETSVAQLLERSSKDAESFRQYLLSELSVTGDRIKTRALGPFNQEQSRQQGILLFLLHP